MVNLFKNEVLCLQILEIYRKNWKGDILKPARQRRKQLVDVIPVWIASVMFFFYSAKLFDEFLFSIITMNENNLDTIQIERRI
jgi:hypothetical protein